MKILRSAGPGLVLTAFAVLLMSASAVRLEAATLKTVRLAEYGHNTTNTIKAPIFDSVGIAPLAIGPLTASYDADAKIVRGLGSVFTKGPSVNLDKNLNLADAFAESLRAEAQAMGFALAPAGASGDRWEVTGELKDVFVESWQITGWGAILFYGFADVAVQVKGPGGVAENRRLRFHYFTEEPGAGSFGRGGKAEAAVAGLFVEAAQELLSRLNRELIKAKSTADMAQKAASLAKSGLKGHEADCHAVGLSGSAEGVAALLSLLPAKKGSEGVAVIDALARAGSPDAIAPLTQRYANEDEQGRWFILKAMDYIGGEAARAFLREKGPSDKDYSVKMLATRSLAAD